MAGVSEIHYQGTSILLVDASGFNVHDNVELLQLVGHAKKAIGLRPLKSVRIITDVTNSRFDIAMADTFKEFGKHNTPYVKASAVVGLSGMQKAIFYAIKSVTGREFYIAKSREDAQEWLIKQ